MRGSGIYAQEFERDVDCDNCGEVTLTFVTDDWGCDASAECECGKTFEYEVPERDEDADYDDWRDSRYDD